MSAKIRGFAVVSDWNRYHFGTEIVLPRRADKGSAGYDIHTPLSLVVPPKSDVLVWTDIKAYMQEDEVLEVHIRSSMGIKKGLQLKNTTGIIDSSYYNNLGNEGNIGICLYNNTNEDVYIEAGDRIAQGIFKKYLIADTDVVSNDTRAGGIGSSGN